MNFKRILAIAAIVLLVGMYVVCLVLSFIHTEMAKNLLLLCMVMTIMIPIIAYILMMFYKLSHRKDDDN